MKRKRRFAEGTKVAVEKSRAEIERLLASHGVSRLLVGSDAQSGSGFVQFELDGRQYRLLLPEREDGRDPNQLERERWRALVLILKAKLEIVASEMTTAENEFLAYLVLPGGNTLGAELAPRLDQAIASGKVTPLLPEWT